MRRSSWMFGIVAAVSFAGGGMARGDSDPSGKVGKVFETWVRPIATGKVGKVLGTRVRSGAGRRSVRRGSGANLVITKELDRPASPSTRRASSNYGKRPKRRRLGGKTNPRAVDFDSFPRVQPPGIQKARKSNPRAVDFDSFPRVLPPGTRKARRTNPRAVETDSFPEVIPPWLKKKRAAARKKATE